MADINKSEIALMKSQRLDDTDQGGGQMTSNPVVDAVVNDLYPDISRFDKVYGDVAIRTGFASIQTIARQTYYGSHLVLTQQAKDPDVSICFFSSENWFDTRDKHQDRIEAYLVKGPSAQLSLWGDHYKGSSNLALVTHLDYPVPEVGDVIVMLDKNTDFEQFMRIIDVDTETRIFYQDGTFAEYQKKIVNVQIGSQLEQDFAGTEVDQLLSTSDNLTGIFTTVAADASKYYGVSPLIEPATQGEYHFRVEDIMTHLVPSAASESAITDFPVGNGTSPMISSRNSGFLSRTVAYKIISAGKLYLGAGILPGTMTWVGGVPMYDDSKGNVLTGSTIIGTIDYPSGTISFGGDIPYDVSGTGTVTYRPAAKPSMVSNTGAIDIAINNRGYIYNFVCDPIPLLGSVRVDYMSAGKWYSIWDQGNGNITGLNGNTDTGSGSVNPTSGTVSVTLGGMPDVDSKVIFYWAKPANFVDYSLEEYDLEYNFNLEHDSITRNTFNLIWTGDATGDGPVGERAIVDDGLGNLVEGTWTGVVYAPIAVPVVIGQIKYTTGKIELSIPDSLAQTGISSIEIFTIQYSYGDKIEEEFQMPPRNMNGTITLNIANTPVLPGTFEIEWHNFLQEYEPDTRIDMSRDPVYIFQDDGAGKYRDDVDDGTTNWMQGVINYATGETTFMPDRTSVFPYPTYKWVDTDFLHPGVLQTRTFDKIEFLVAASLFPTDSNVIVRFCSVDGVNNHSYTSTITPSYQINPTKSLQLLPGSVVLSDGVDHIQDGGDGILYSMMHGETGQRSVVGAINYATRTFTITDATVAIWNMSLVWCTATGDIEPTMSLVFRAPAAPIRSGSFSVKATTQSGTIITGTADFSGDITGNGILGHINYNTGLAHVAFGEWVLDDAAAQDQDWYAGAPVNGGNVWKPYVVHAYTVLINSVVTNYLPLDADIIGLDPVRLPLDGKVPIFRDGYVILIQHPVQDSVDTSGWPATLLTNQVVNASRGDVEEIIVSELPTAYDISEGDLTTAKVITDAGNYTMDTTAGTVEFLSGFVMPTDGEGTRRQIEIMTVREDMLLVSDVQITGHISTTTPLSHDYPAAESQVSSVLYLGDLQSRGYNEFEQTSWTNVWSDELIGSAPLASYNFVDYPITVINKSCTKERWLIQFTSGNNVRIIGENAGVLAENVQVSNYVPDPPTLEVWDGVRSGAFEYQGVNCLVAANRQFPGFPFWVMPLAGFGLGWSSGNCIRFNTDAANFPVTFIRTTLQSPAGNDPNDHFTLQIRGDSS